MAKPTLLQALLNRPSQSYTNYAEKEYHSARQEFARAAAASSSSRASTSNVVPGSSQYPRDTVVVLSTARAAALIDPPSSRTAHNRSQNNYNPRPPSSAQNDLIANSYLPSGRSHPSHSNPLPLALILSPHPPSHPPHRKDTARPLPSLPDPHLLHAQVDININRTRPDRLHEARPSSGAAREPSLQDSDQDQDITQDGEEQDEDDTQTDVFYTPLTSPVVSMLIDPASIASVLPSPPRPLHLQRESTSSTSSNDSEDGSISTTPTSDDSLSAAAKDKDKLERKNVPVDVIDGMHAPERTALNVAVKPLASTTTTPISSSTAPRPAVHSSSMISTAVSRISQSAEQPRHRRFSSAPTSSPPVRLKYTDEDWAKEVRWLDPSSTSTSSHKPAKPASKHKHQHLVHDSEYADLPVPHRRPRTGRSRTTSARPRSKVQMTALWEEDEDGSTISDHHHHHQPHPSSSHGHGHPKAPSDSLVLTSELRARSRTASESSISISPSISRSNSLKSTTSPRTRSTPPSRSATLSVRSGTSGTASTSSSRSPYTLPSRTVTLPTPLPVPAPASTTSTHHLNDGALADLGATAAPSTSGYTTMTLPRAAYKPADPWRTIGGGKVDLAREGKAQTTMASVEVVRGVAETLPGGKGGLLKRSGSSAKRSSWLFAGNGAGAAGSKVDLAKMGSGSGLGSLADAVALTSHLAPPSHCPSSHVLIQVHAVALEGLDRELVLDKVKRSSGAGFVPGRSVVGRVVEVGWEVKEEIARRGEWVVGLVDPKKCGALAEFVILERHRLHRAPQPYLPTPNLFPSKRNLPSQPSGPTLQSLALLPLIGVPAYRALRTYLAAVERGGIKGQAPSHTPSKARGIGGRALILRGQDGVGGVAAQMLIHKGVEVWVQVEASIAGVDDTDGEDGEGNVLVFESGDALEWEDADGKVRSGREGDGVLEEICERLRGWGVTGICVGGAVDVIHVLRERLDVAEAELEAGVVGQVGEGEEALRGGGFDFVLDTVGGREVWEAGQALLSRPQSSHNLVPPRTPSSPRSPTSDLSTSDSNSSPTAWMDAQFTTVVGDKGSGKALPSTQDHWRAGVRSLKRAMVPSSSSPASTTPIALSPSSPLSRSGSSTPISPGSRSARSSSEFVVRESMESSMLSISDGHGLGRPRKLNSSSPNLMFGSEKERKKLAKKQKQKVRKPRTVGYTWVSSVADVDFEGTDVRDALGALIDMLDGPRRRLRPDGCIEGEVYGTGRVVPFERTPEVFVGGSGRGRGGKSAGLLEGGGTVVVRVVG